MYSSAPHHRATSCWGAFENCAKSYKLKQCPCFKNDRSCSQYCHGGDDNTCNNLPDTIIDRTESAFIDNQSKLSKSKRKRAATISSPKEHRQTKKPSRQSSPPHPLQITLRQRGNVCESPLKKERICRRRRRQRKELVKRRQRWTYQQRKRQTKQRCHSMLRQSILSAI